MTTDPKTAVVPDLLPCPFCGGTAEIERFGNTRVSTIYICTDCCCRLETGEEFHHGRSWNYRAAPQPVSPPTGEGGATSLSEGREEIARIVHRWVRDEAPTGMKMMFTPELAESLILSLLQGGEGAR